MDVHAPEFNEPTALQVVLGYLNFSEGRPDPRFQKTLSEVYAHLAAQGVEPPWRELEVRLQTRLYELRASGLPAFRNINQARRVLLLVYNRCLPAYRAYHADLLAHLTDAELFQPFFLARVFEAVLALQAHCDNDEQLVQRVLKTLNDYVGHRPVAVLESRTTSANEERPAELALSDARGEPYPHERVRPIPLYIRGAGVAFGKYQALVSVALNILQQTDPGLLAEACFDPQLLDELALDPRAYDHGHPVNRRPNYLFGEWDPHHIDNAGRYRRFIVRPLVLDALLERVQQANGLSKEAQSERLFEAGAVLAGTILMAAGVSGSGPETHDSTVNLSNLVPRIARYRDAFYTSLLGKVQGAHGICLQREAERLRQPFGGARQHLNQCLARHRAAQLQQRHLAVLLAEIGYPEASRRQVAQVPSASVRFLSEIHIRLTLGQTYIDAGQLDEAARQLPEIENLLHRGIECGALADPWNILGHGGLFPLFTSMEDSIRDPRIDELVALVERTFNLYARLLSDSAASGRADLGQKLAADMRRLANWWDRFATYTVSDVQRVQGSEASSSAEHVATALRRWRERGEATADLAFWRQYLEGFRSPKAFAVVVDALLRKQDYRAALALLMNWLSQLDQVPLEDSEYSFHTLALRWMLGMCQQLFPQEARSKLAQATAAGQPLPQGPPDIIVKFFDYLEANAEDYWNVPQLEVMGIPLEEGGEDTEAEEEEDLYRAAYEEVTYEDSTDDDVEAEVLEIGPRPVFDLELESERIEKHLRFLSTVARLWNIATRMTRPAVSGESAPLGPDSPLRSWLRRAQHNQRELLHLLDIVHRHPVPEPSGGQDALVEYDRRRVLKDRLLHVIIATCLETSLAVGALQGRLGEYPAGAGWEHYLIHLEQGMWQGNKEAVRRLIPEFLQAFREEPLLFTPLSNGGHPQQILRASRAQTILRALAANLPRLGLLRETWLVVKAAHDMERHQPLEGPRVTEFDRLFQIACQAAVEAVIDSASAAPPDQCDDQLPGVLERLIQPFLPLWAEHSRTLRVAMLEAVPTETEWVALKTFLQRYGRELFTVRFLALGNLRGILHRGVGAWLDYLREHPDPLQPLTLLEDLDRVIPRAEAERRLQTILQTLIENYEIYKDYNATSPQSDYGENLAFLFDFLRLKANYERQAWQLRPLILIHEVLARRRCKAAVRWQEQMARLTAFEANRLLEQLDRLERQHGLRLNTVTDRLQERFVKPLALDRLCALIESAMKAAHTPEAPALLAELERELRPYIENPTGVGLDVPHWLQRLHHTIQQVRASKTAIANLAEHLLQIPKIVVPLEQLQRELNDWHKE